MRYVDESCPVCETGAVGFWRCGDAPVVTLMCGECHSVWQDPALEAGGLPRCARDGG